MSVYNNLTQKFDLNVVPDQEPTIIHVDQYDHSYYRLSAQLYVNDQIYDPGEGASAIIQGKKPDGHGFAYTAWLSGPIGERRVSAHLTEQMTAVAGDVRTQIVVTDSTGRAGTFAFILRVQPSALPDDTDMSESDYAFIEEALEEAEDAASRARSSAESSATSAATSQTQANSSRQSALDSEAWAVGQRNGSDVGAGDDTYHNNSRYYSSIASGAVTSAQAILGQVNDAKDDALDAIQDALEETLPSFTVDANGDLLYTGNAFVFTVDSAGDLLWSMAT